MLGPLLFEQVCPGAAADQAADQVLPLFLSCPPMAGRTNAALSPTQQDMADHHKALKSPKGEALYGVGKPKGDEWWKGLGGLLVGQGLLEYRTVALPGGRSYSALCVTSKGRGGGGGLCSRKGWVQGCGPLLERKACHTLGE